jgi:hypothetical protein
VIFAILGGAVLIALVLSLGWYGTATPRRRAPGDRQGPTITGADGGYPVESRQGNAHGSDIGHHGTGGHDGGHF